MKHWDEVFMANYGTPQLTLVSGVGNKVKDSHGVEYLDFLGGIATNILGHAHPAITAAVTEQLTQLTHVSNFYAHPQGLTLAAKLQSLIGDNSARTFFCNSGAEANEAALKISRLTGRKKIVAFVNSFHGRTMGALSMTGQSSKRDPFKPLIPHISFLPYGDERALKRGISKRTAMVIIEPIQGEAGVIAPPTGFLKKLRERTCEVGALLAVDEVQTGMGRTGTWFAYQREGITPDIITLAKGLGGGLPLGATIGWATGKSCSAWRSPQIRGSRTSWSKRGQRRWVAYRYRTLQSRCKRDPTRVRERTNLGQRTNPNDDSDCSCVDYKPF